MMTTPADHSRDTETCRKLISLGFSRSNRVRLYGQEVELLSDPYPKEGGIAVEVTSGEEALPRTMRLPLTVLQMAAQKKRVA